MRLLYSLGFFFSLEEALNDNTVQFRNWLFFLYYSFLKGYSLSSGLSYLFCVLLQKHEVHVTAKLPAICNIVLLIKEILLMKTEIYIFPLMYVSMTSTFNAGPFACQFLHDDTKEEYTQISLLFLQENEHTATLFEDQNCKRKKLFKLFRKKMYFVPFPSVGTTTGLYSHFI